MIIMDPLYGNISFSESINSLIRTAAVQRLRHIRLSNIDSLCMPGIANISRYEHSLGVAHLASRLSLQSNLSEEDAITLQAAALLHDSMISPFGHLVEEALSFLDIDYNHEMKMNQLISGYDSQEIGGLDRQFLYGNTSGLTDWANDVFGSDSDRKLNYISQLITGKGGYGKYISGEIDLDNIDNVCRASFHIGLKVNKELPLNITDSIIITLNKHEINFSKNGMKYLEEWINLRRDLYTYFMLSREDFSAKVMLLYAVISAYLKEDISTHDWDINDIELVSRLLKCRDKMVQDTTRRWLIGDLWDLSQLFWFKSPPPAYTDVLKFSTHISNALNRQCFAYRIKDKRCRIITACFGTDNSVKLGKSPSSWLMGIASSNRKPFSNTDNQAIIDAAASFFNTQYDGLADIKRDLQPKLFN